MGAMQTHLLGAPEPVRTKRNSPKWNPRKIRDGQRCCPRCNLSMRYKRVHGKMSEWSPCDHAWICDSCPMVFMIDGSIDPDEDTWQTRERKTQRRQLNSYLASLFDIRSDEGEDQD